MDISGLGGETIDLLYKNGLIANYADLYKLKKEDLIPLERMAEKSAENILHGLNQSKQIEFERVLFALGIRFVGQTVAKKITKAFQNIDNLINSYQCKIKSHVFNDWSITSHCRSNSNSRKACLRNRGVNNPFITELI